MRRASILWSGLQQDVCLCSEEELSAFVLGLVKVISHQCGRPSSGTDEVTAGQTCTQLQLTYSGRELWGSSFVSVFKRDFC